MEPSDPANPASPLRARNVPRPGPAPGLSLAFGGNLPEGLPSPPPLSPPPVSDAQGRAQSAQCGSTSVVSICMPMGTVILQQQQLVVTVAPIAESAGPNLAN